MDVHFKRLLVTSGSHNIRIRVYQEKESTCFANVGWFLLELGNIKGVAELALKDGWLKLITHCDVVHLRECFSKKVPLVEAEGDKCRGRKIAFLVWSQVDRVEGQCW